MKKPARKIRTRRALTKIEVDRERNWLEFWRAIIVHAFRLIALIVLACLGAPSIAELVNLVR